MTDITAKRHLNPVRPDRSYQVSIAPAKIRVGKGGAVS
jgi:hypothetical protein